MSDKAPAIFDEIELEWEGVSYRISGDAKIMQMLARIEEHITFMELERARSVMAPPFAKLSQAYCIALQTAGCYISPAEVYLGMWKDGKSGDQVIEAIGGLLKMMLPRSVLEAAAEEAEADLGKV